MIRSGTILDTTELEGNPFADVIAEYKRHGRKAVEKGNLTTAVYYFGTANQLENM